jgi:6,7-dimethyl-8-ribityllumazine synthase
MQTFEGHFDARGHKYGIVVARFNRPITELLLEGAIDALTRHGVEKADIAVSWVPGAFEIPLIAQKMAESKKYDGIISIGAVIRGETAHFDFVAAQSAAGVMQSNLSSGIPVIYAILTTENKEQAEVRAGTKSVNLGFSYALSAIEMVNLIKNISHAT